LSITFEKLVSPETRPVLFQGFSMKIPPLFHVLKIDNLFKLNIFSTFKKLAQVGGYFYTKGDCG